MATSVDNPPVPCKWYVSIDQPECGKKSTEMVRVKTRLVDVTVPLCPQHLARHRDNQMQARHARKEASRG